MLRLMVLSTTEAAIWRDRDLGLFPAIDCLEWSL